MKSFVGYIFTETPVHDLRNRGIPLQKDPSHIDQGFYSYFLVLNDQTCVEFREVIDEQIYLKKYNLKNFEPMLSQADTQLKLNSDFKLAGTLFKDDILDSELKTYFTIRKEFNFWAVHLKTKNYEEFKKQCRADKIINLTQVEKSGTPGEQALLIHLGPNCFDLIVSGSD